MAGVGTLLLGVQDNGKFCKKLCKRLWLPPRYLRDNAVPNNKESKAESIKKTFYNGNKLKS